MTDTPASTGVSVPALYIDQTDYTLTVSDDLAESFDITASVDGRAIITGHDFRPPMSGRDPRDNPADLASMFDAFLGAEIERADYGSTTSSRADMGEIWDGWTIHDSDADLGNLADACALYGGDESSC